MTKRAQAMLAQMDRATARWVLPIIGREKGRFVARLIARERPTRALEIGSLIGYSTILIAASLPPGGRLVSIEVSPYLARITERNVEAAGLGPRRQRRGEGRVRVIAGDARRVIPLLRQRFDFVLIDAAKQEYLDYLRALEPRLKRGALVIADNTKIYRRELRRYLSRARTSGRYASREQDFGKDAMEVSRFLG
ncbi:MAG: class I SAM-dependent methyltransferase [Candidatus Rokubacteria bacterium]|nr:class I SAM-dependent methyltransferase [Candidatus Rokubacteria bacterium]